jgi:hypothetical protein
MGSPLGVCDIGCAIVTLGGFMETSNGKSAIKGGILLHRAMHRGEVVSAVTRSRVVFMRHGLGNGFETSRATALWLGTRL